jgi:hypothetical protein
MGEIDMTKELEAMDLETLNKLHTRLVSTAKHLEDSLATTELENETLRAEIVEQNKTIDMMLGSLGQLKIGAINTPAPVINGDTRAAAAERRVRRVVSNIAPEKATIKVSEKLGELRAAEPRLREVKDQVQTKVSTAATSALELGSNALEKGKSLWGSMFEPAPQPKRRAGKGKGKGRPRKQPDAEAPAEPAAEPAEPEEDLSTLDPTADASKDEAERWADTVEATLLLEVQIDIGDGQVCDLRVRAADRVSEVAAKFVEENALKKQFLPPLIAYLRQVEDDADTFPVNTSATLSEIFEHFSE